MADPRNILDFCWFINKNLNKRPVQNYILQNVAGEKLTLLEQKHQHKKCLDH